MNVARIWIAIVVIGVCHLGRLFVAMSPIEARLLAIVPVATFAWLARAQTDRLFVHVAFVVAVAFIVNATFTMASLSGSTEGLARTWGNVALWAAPPQVLRLQAVGLAGVALLGVVIGRISRVLAA